MSAFDQSILTQFTGTEHYYRLNRKCVLTDGTKYLAEAAGAYWLMDTAASYLLELGTADWFVLIRLVVNDSAALLTLEDGNGRIRARQEIPFTDFPANEQVLYAVWDGEHWVLMLPSEY
jgi:N-acetylglucosamine-6-phosphate deacetylase